MTTRYSDIKSVCVTLNAVETECNAYESVWPNNVTVCPCRPPKTGKRENNQYRSHFGGRPSMNNQPLIPGKKEQYSYNKQYDGPVNEQHALYKVPLLRQQSNYMPLSVHHRSPQTWSGADHLYNRQFMPLMSLPTTI